MKIFKLTTWMLSALLIFAFASGQAFADDVDAPEKRGGPDGKTHENIEEVETTGELVGEHDAKKKPAVGDGKAHKNTEEVETTGELVGEHDAPNKSAAQRLVGSHDEEFMVLDMNNDGLIDKDERIGDAAMGRHMKVVDKNGDGSIDKSEYEAYYGMRYYGN